MGKIFSISRQKIQELLLTSTNMLKQLEVGKVGRLSERHKKVRPEIKKWMPGEHAHQASIQKVSYSSADRRSQRSS